MFKNAIIKTLPLTFILNCRSDVCREIFRILSPLSSRPRCSTACPSAPKALTTETTLRLIDAAVISTTILFVATRIYSRFFFLNLFNGKDRKILLKISTLPARFKTKTLNHIYFF